MQPAKILFLIALYRNDDEVLAFLEQLAAQDFRDISVLVVTNAAVDAKKLDEQLRLFRFATRLDPGKNLGYFGAAHYAFERYRQSFGVPELTVVCNTDLTLEHETFLKELTKYVGDETIAAVGPSVISSFSRNDMNPYLTQRYPMRHLKRLKFVYSFYPLYGFYELTALIKSKITHQGNRKQTSGETYAVYGAFIAFTKAFFERGGTLSHGAFLYGEEIFVAEQARQLGMKIWFDGSLRVTHNEHSTTGYVKSPRHVCYLHDSIAFILKAFYDER